jgi:hypothetical protein
MSKTRNNHYVPQWYQEGFFEIGRSTLAYLDMKPAPRDYPAAFIALVERSRKVSSIGE